MKLGLASLDAMKPGLVLGRYQCLMPIARGGMAAVWAARVKGARGFESIVALKTMLPILSDDPSFTMMFLEEARIASLIRHPNVALVTDLGEEGDLLYLVMEWVDAEPLSFLLREAADRGGVPIEIALRIVQDACAGLHAAHELRDDEGKPLGIVHRDVSPQNVLVGANGIVKLVDFGIAKVTAKSSHETAPGQVRGKVAYMAPEQTLGKHLDRRADVFAMGTVLYQLLVGKHPFRGESDAETIQNIVLKEVPPPNLVSARPIPEALEAVILRALERDPARRWATAADLAAALERAEPPGAPRAGTAAVAAYMDEVLGDRIRARRDALRQAQAVVDGEATPRSIPKQLEVVTSEVSARWEIPASARDSMVSAAERRTRDVTATSLLGARAAGPWRAATFALAALLLTGVVLVLASSASTPPSPAATAPPPPAISVAPPVAVPAVPTATATAIEASQPGGVSSSPARSRTSTATTPPTSAEPAESVAPSSPRGQPARAPRLPRPVASGTPRFAPPVPSPGF